MNISMLKALLNACYQAKRVHELLPALLRYVEAM